MKFYVNEGPASFSVVEEEEVFRMVIRGSEIDEDDVEDFLDTTVEWLSTNPEKGILIDFEGVKAVCGNFVVHLTRYYEEIKARGLHVRFVNVDPAIKDYVDGSTITVVLTAPLYDKAVVNAKDILEDLEGELSDRDLMKKYGLSPKGLESMFGKLLASGLITQKTIDRRGGHAGQVSKSNDEAGLRRAVVGASSAVKDVHDMMTDHELMKKYRLSRRGLQSMLRKLYRKGLVSKEVLMERRNRGKDYLEIPLDEDE